MLKIKFFQSNENEGFKFPFILVYPEKFNKNNKIFIVSVAKTIAKIAPM